MLESEWAHYVTEYHWIVFDLGLTREVRGIRIYQGATSLWGRALGLYGYVSDDPADWGAAVWEGTLNSPMWPQSGEFSKDGRYIKLLSKSNASSQWMFQFQAVVGEEELELKIKPALLKVENLLATSGLFRGGTQIGEPKKAPGDTFAALMLGNGSIEELRYGTQSMDRREIIIRIYINMLSEPEEEIEFMLDEIWDTLKPILISGLELGVTGIYCAEPSGITYSCGYVTVDQTIFRQMDISIPMLIDDAATTA